MKEKMTNEEFVRLYLSCRSARDMAEKSGMKINTIQQRSRRLRRAGVMLPQFLSTVGERVNATKLNKIIEQEANQDGY